MGEENKKKEGNEKEFVPAHERARILLQNNPKGHVFTLGRMYERTIIPLKKPEDIQEIHGLIEDFKKAAKAALSRKDRFSARDHNAANYAIAALEKQLAEAKAKKERGEPPFIVGEAIKTKKVPVLTYGEQPGDINITKLGTFIVREIRFSKEYGWVVEVNELSDREIAGVYPADAFKKLYG